MSTTRTIAGALLAAALFASSSALAASVADNVPLDRLRVIAILSGDTPRAMLSDPSDRGWVVKRGDLVGRADEGPACRWRVTAIRSDSVLFVRDDAHCAASPKTKTLKT